MTKIQKYSKILTEALILANIIVFDKILSKYYYVRLFYCVLRIET